MGDSAVGVSGLLEAGLDDGHGRPQWGGEGGGGVGLIVQVTLTLP